jgi:hypothetical protein
MNEFSVALSFYDAGPAENGQVLGSDGLLQAQVDIEFGNREFFIFVQYTNDLLAQLMVQGPQDHSGFLEVDKVNFYGRIIPSVGVDNHPVITDCTSHDGNTLRVQ